MSVENIAKETSLSTKTVARRLENMTENPVLQLTINTDTSSLRLASYMEFVLLIGFTYTFLF